MFKCLFNTRLDSINLTQLSPSFLSSIVESINFLVVIFFIEICPTNFISTFIICRRNEWIWLGVLRLFILLVSGHINFSQFMMQSATMGIFYFRSAFSRFAWYFISFYYIFVPRIWKRKLRYSKWLSLILSSCEMNLRIPRKHEENLCDGFQICSELWRKIHHISNVRRKTEWLIANHCASFGIILNWKNSIVNFVILIKPIPENLYRTLNFWLPRDSNWIEWFWW